MSFDKCIYPYNPITLLIYRMFSSSQEELLVFLPSQSPIPRATSSASIHHKLVFLF